MEKNIDKTNDFLLIIDGSSLLSTQFFGNLPREIVFAKTQEEKERYFHKIMQTRITSYNVCYTKLLRNIPCNCEIFRLLFFQYFYQGT